MNRILYVDVVKCLAIFLVVWGHLIPNCSAVDSVDMTIYSVIFSFHMPLFAIMSGMFFRPDTDWKTFLRNKTLGILLPLVFWSFLQEGLISPVRMLMANEAISVHGVVRNCFYCVMYWELWFLKALFMCFCYAYVSAHWFHSVRSVIVVGVCSVLLLYLLSLCGILPNKSQFLIGFIFLYPFFWVGYILRQCHWIESKLVWLMAALVWIVLFQFWQGHDDTFYGMNTSYFAHDGVNGMLLVQKVLLRLLIGIAGSVALIGAIRQLATILSESNVWWNHIAKAGQYTLGVYTLHWVIIMRYVPMPTVPDGMVGVVLCWCLSVLVMAGCLFMCRLLMHNKWIAMLTIGKN